MSIDNGWGVDSLLTAKNEVYETKLLKNLQNEHLWLEYYESLGDEASIKEKVFILHRAVQFNSQSGALWLLYCDLAVKVAEKLQYYHHKSDLALVNRIFTRAIHAIPDNDAIWHKYLSFLLDKQYANVTFVRRAFNSCLAALPVAAHTKIWPLYLQFADKIGGITASSVYSKYLLLDTLTSDIELILQKFAEFNDDTSLLKLYETIISNPEKFTLSKSILEIWWDYIDHYFNIALDHQNQRWDSQFEGKIRMAVGKFPDQMGKLYTTLTTYYNNRNNSQKVRYYFDIALSTCVTVPDFVMIYNEYVDFEELELDSLAQDLQQGTVGKFEFRMNYYQNLLANRAILLNDMKLRKDVNNLDTWYERLGLYQHDVDNCLKTYVQALTKINPFKAHSSSKNTLSKLWMDYANVYASQEDYRTTNLVFSKAVTSQFSTADQLCDLYIKWSEIILESSLEDAEDKAIEIIEKVLFKTPSKSEKSTIHDEIRKSKLLWAYYIDLLESLVDSREQQKQINRVAVAYDKIIDVKIATAQNILNYAEFLQSWSFWEKSYSIYERGLKLFPDSIIIFEIWNTYLDKVLQNKLPVERIRDLFDQCLSGNDGTRMAGYLCKPIIKLCAQFERNNGLMMKSIKCLERGIQFISKAVNEDNLLKPELDRAYDDKFELYGDLIDTISLMGAHDELRATFEQALQDKQLRFIELIEIVHRFINFEIEQKQYARVRGLFEFICRLSNPDSMIIKSTWSKWENFELEFGNESTFKEMLRFKRLVAQELKQEESIKDSLNPMGFIKSETIQKGKLPPPINPDQIDIDMDM